VEQEKAFQLQGHAVTNSVNFDPKNDAIGGENSDFFIDSSFISG